MFQRGLSQASHQASLAKLGRIVLRRSGLTQVSGNTRLQNQAGGVLLILQELTLKSVEGELDGVQNTHNVDGEDAQFRFFRPILVLDV